MVKKIVRVDFKVNYGKYKDKTLVWVINNDLEYFKSIKGSYYAKYDELHKQFYDHLYKKVESKLKFLNEVTDQEKVLTNKVADEMCKGASLTSILVTFRQQDFTDKQVYDAINRAKVTVKKHYDSENTRMVNLHILRYEDFFKDNINPDLSKVLPAYRKQVLADKFNVAMESLLAKEKMLGIHTKTFKIKYSNYISTQRQVNKKDFDFKKLTIKERFKLLEIIEKSEVRKNDDIKPIIKQASDIQDAVIIKETKKEEIELSPLNEVKLLNQKEEDKKKEPKVNRSFQDIQRMIQENAKKELEEKMKGSENKNNIKDFR